jgi:hypothetical protein
LENAGKSRNQEEVGEGFHNRNPAPPNRRAQAGIHSGG